MAETIPLLTDILELYTTTPEGLPLWKTKGVELNFKNILTDVFVLSTDLAIYFGMYHFHLKRNIYKLLKENYLDHATKIGGMIQIGRSAQRLQIIYALTRQQTELLIMDFSGPKAREKKFSIVKRLHAIENDLTQGFYESALQKTASWDGVQLLTDLGFTPSLPNKMATKKDIATFLGVPESTLATFLSKHTDQIIPSKLTKEQIRAIGKKTNRLNAYSQDDVFKIAFWMDTKIGKQLKTKIFGDIGVCATPVVKDETEWKFSLSELFHLLGFKYQYHIGKYVVDFFVEKLGLVLECDRENHRYYNQKKEQERDAYITQFYTLIRFNSQISVETLANQIIRMTEMPPKAAIKLYIPPEKAKSKNRR